MEKKVPPSHSLDDTAQNEADFSASEELQSLADQTFFAEDVVIEDVHALDATGQPDGVSPPWWRSRKGLFAIAGGAMFVLAIMVALLLSLNQQIQVVPEEKTPQQSASEEAVSELQKQLLLLSEDIAAADPLQTELAFPPVDFSLELEDALSAERLQELQQNRQR